MQEPRHAMTMYAALLVLALGIGASAAPVDEFYKGKTVAFVVGCSAGGRGWAGRAALAKR